jgi:hypothetical protein
MEYTLKLSNTERVIATPDLQSYDLTEVIGEDYGLFVTSSGYGVRTSAYGMAGEHQKELERLASNFYDRDMQERAIILWLGLLGFAAEAIQLQGYSQGEWMRGVLFRERFVDETKEQLADSLAEARKYANAWFAGDIFTIHRETLETYANVTDVHDTITKWQEIDSLGCIVLFDPKDLIEAAHDHFGIPKLDWTVTY